MNFKPAYSYFSQIYDPVMQHIDFRSWAEFILSAYREYAIKEPKSILDIGCGTGELLAYFPKKVYKCGVDNSLEMLEIARKKNPQINFIYGDMEKLKMPSTYDLIVSTHDSINYLTDFDKLHDHFSAIYSTLKTDGLYYFDVSSEYNLEVNFHRKVFREKHGDISLVWENFYDKKKREILSVLTFRQSGEEYVEEHRQRFYSQAEIKSILKHAKLQLLRIGSDYKTWSLDRKAALIGFLCRKK
ncbi:MAG: class I SAM-dependent methyltransferase [Spirochaetota bacterium]